MRFIAWQKVYIGDSLGVLSSLAESSVDTVMTSPPYWGLRDYGVEGQIGLENDPLEYIDRMVQVFDEVKRVLKPTGSAYVVLGDTYCSPGKWGGPTKQSLTGTRNRGYPEGIRPNQVSRPTVDWVRGKQLALIPSRFAIAMQDRGWILRNDIIWHKVNGLPSSVKDRLSNRYEHVFHFVKSEHYYYNLEAIREPYKTSSFKRFGGLIAQGFARKETKYALLDLPSHSQFSAGKIPVPSWLKDSIPKTINARAPTKAEVLYQLTKGRIGHGHYKSGEYRGIHGHPLGKNPGDVWPLSASSYRGAHFSVYPERLCVRPILSSCPSLVCKKCGSPKREVVSAASGAAFNIRVRDAKKGTLDDKWGNRVSASQSEVQRYDEAFYAPTSKPRVIADGCLCVAGFDPGIVLDPFVGSGTTMKVAFDLGRNCIGIDINPEYVVLIQDRVPQLRDEDIVFIGNERQGRQASPQTYLRQTAETASGAVERN